MPGGDGTGPAGMGPLTGRGAGYCAGNTMPGISYPGYGRGFGFGRGFCGGRPWRRGAGFPRYAFGGPDAFGYTGVPSRQQELQSLKSQASYLQKTLEEINRRISDLEEAGQ